MLALGILFWAIFLPIVPLRLGSWELSKLWYFGLVVSSYFAGHVLQSVSRTWFKNPDETVLADPKSSVAALLEGARSQIADHLGLEKPSMLTNSALVRLCDEVAVQNGQPGDREVFVYREGFYRGSIAAFLLLDVALIVRCTVSGASLSIGTLLVPVSKGELTFLIIVVTSGLFFIWRRYKHFASLRVMRAITAFVSIFNFKSAGQQAGKITSISDSRISDIGL